MNRLSSPFRNEIFSCLQSLDEAVQPLVKGDSLIEGVIRGAVQPHAKPVVIPHPLRWMKVFVTEGAIRLVVAALAKYLFEAGSYIVIA